MKEKDMKPARRFYDELFASVSLVPGSSRKKNSRKKFEK